MANETGKGRIQPVDEVKLLRAAACDWRLSRGDIGVFAVLLKHCDDEWLAYPGPTRISGEARLATSNVKASLRHLELLKYISTERPGLRKANRYTVLDSPRVMDQKTVRIIQKTRRNLGLRADPALGMRTGPDSKSSNRATRPAANHPLGLPSGRQLGLPTGHEVALEVTTESTAASPRLLRKEQQERQQEADDVF